MLALYIVSPISVGLLHISGPQQRGGGGGGGVGGSEPPPPLPPALKIINKLLHADWL